MRTFVLLLMVMLNGGALGQELGRLFFTPEQRAALDARRQAGVPDPPVAAPTVVKRPTRLDGYVRRSDGRAAMWVNGTVVDDRPLQPALDGRVLVPVDDTGRRARLKPGQVVDGIGGEVSDVLGDRGELRIRAPQ